MRKNRHLILFACAAALLILVLTRWLWPQPDPMYTVTILPSLGGAFTLPCAINDRGQIAGFSEVSQSKYHLFLWDRQKGMQDLGPVCNDMVDLNSAGQITGTMHDPNSRERAFVWDPHEGRRLLPTLGGSKGRALAINDSGQVVGGAETAAGIVHAFVWDPASGIRDLTPSSTTLTRAISVNNAGQVILAATGGPVLMDLRDAGATAHPISARGLIEINNAGDVAGFVPTGPRSFDVVVWRENTGTRKLFQMTADGADTTKMNEAGQVAFAQTSRSRLGLLGRRLFAANRMKTFLWDPNRGPVPLDRYVSVGRTDELWLTDLNNHGCLIGAVQSTKDSRSQGVLFEPIPERWEK
jgi:probable HAF family extracellular repeat protein